MKCAKCHGELGKGDGPSAPELTDDNGLPIKPRDFSDASQFVAASDPKGIYQTFTTGLDGTPMPTFADFLNEQKRWQLVWYVMSLRPNFDLERTRQEMLRQQGGALAQAGARAEK
jgi:cytochrome c oxidase cbb3-type subunit 2